MASRRPFDLVASPVSRPSPQIEHRQRSSDAARRAGRPRRTTDSKGMSRESVLWRARAPAGQLPGGRWCAPRRPGDGLWGRPGHRHIRSGDPCRHYRRWRQSSGACDCGKSDSCVAGPSSREPGASWLRQGSDVAITGCPLAGSTDVDGRAARKFLVRPKKEDDGKRVLLAGWPSRHSLHEL